MHERDASTVGSHTRATLNARMRPCPRGAALTVPVSPHHSSAELDMDMAQSPAPGAPGWPMMWVPQPGSTRDAYFHVQAVLPTPTNPNKRNAMDAPACGADTRRKIALTRTGRVRCVRGPRGCPQGCRRVAHPSWTPPGGAPPRCCAASAAAGPARLGASATWCSATCRLSPPRGPSAGGPPASPRPAPPPATLSTYCHSHAIGRATGQTHEGTATRSGGLAIVILPSHRCCSCWKTCSSGPASAACL